MAAVSRKVAQFNRQGPRKSSRLLASAEEPPLGGHVHLVSLHLHDSTVISTLVMRQ